jgi:steroid delta-isomerase-like uncharacterized protein
MSEIRKRIDAIRTAWNNHDAPEFAAQFSEDAVLRFMPTGGVAHGREQIQAFAETELRAFPDWQIEGRNAYDCGEGVCVVEWTVTATHEGEFMGISPTHRSVEMLGCSIFVLGADGLVGEEIIYLDAATILRQLGVLPASADA